MRIILKHFKDCIKADLKKCEIDTCGDMRGSSHGQTYIYVAHGNTQRLRSVHGSRKQPKSIDIGSCLKTNQQVQTTSRFF